MFFRGSRARPFTLPDTVEPDRSELIALEDRLLAGLAEHGIAVRPKPRLPWKGDMHHRVQLTFDEDKVVVETRNVPRKGPQTQGVAMADWRTIDAAIESVLDDLRGQRLPEASRGRTVALSIPLWIPAGSLSPSTRDPADRDRPPGARNVHAQGGNVMDAEELYELVYDAVRQAIADQDGGDGRLLRRFEGGKVVFEDKFGKVAKEVPALTVFKKVTSVREQLRVLEQKLNSHAALSDADKADLQRYLTRAYGSLTTFNFMFADEGAKFQGSGG